MLILGVETSCDETGLALYDAGAGGLLAHAVHSQVAMHEAYGGAWSAKVSISLICAGVKARTSVRRAFRDPMSSPC